MKKLFSLLLVWLALTIYLAYGNFQYKRFVEENIEWRAFLVYQSSLAGCMIGAEMAYNNFNFQIIYHGCKEYAFREKTIYKSRWKK